MKIWRFGVLVSIFLLPRAARSQGFDINLKGGGVLLSKDQPSERDGRMTFHRSPDGTLMSVKTDDVAGIATHQETAPPPGAEALGPVGWERKKPAASGAAAPAVSPRAARAPRRRVLWRAPPPNAVIASPGAPPQSPNP